MSPGSSGQVGEDTWKGDSTLEMQPSSTGLGLGEEAFSAHAEDSGVSLPIQRTGGALRGRNREAAGVSHHCGNDDPDSAHHTRMRTWASLVTCGRQFSSHV